MREWSKYQQAIFDEVETGSGNIVVVARAGSGKTTANVEVARRASALGLRVLACAFNTVIKDELAARLTGTPVDVKSLNGLGFSAVISSFGRLKVNDRREGDLLFAWGRQTGTYLHGEPRQAALKLVAWAKNTLSPCSARTARAAGVTDLANGRLDTVIEAAQAVLAASQKVQGEISFNDQIWLPHVLDLGLPERYDLVLVDESQDLNAAQIELVRKAIRPGGRIVAVGDDRQAIYQFRGADPDAINRVVDGLNAKVMPLSITYRCPQQVVALAQQIVPDLEAAENAIKGEVVETDSKALDNANPGDFVISRTNAPLVPLCLRYLRRGIPAVVAGRDVGARLTSLVERASEKVGQDLLAIVGWVRAWSESERAKISASSGDDESETMLAAIEAVSDVEETLLAVLDGCQTLVETRERMGRLFGGDRAGDAAGKIRLSTVHKAKGLESNTVYLLTSTFRPGRNVGEDNLLYVAITRAKQTLIFVS